MIDKKLIKEFFLLFVFLCIGVIAVNAADGYFLEAPSIASIEKKNEVIVRNKEADIGIMEEMSVFLMSYFETWFDASASLEENDINAFFDTSDKMSAVYGSIDQMVLSFLIEVRMRQDTDLRMNEYTVGITYRSIENLENGDIQVILDEDSRCRFRVTENIDSTSAGIRHVFVLRKTEDRYTIISHEKDEDGYLMFTSLFDEKTLKSEEINQVKAVLESGKENFLKQADNDIAFLKTQKETVRMEEKPKALDSFYDREKAVGYAMQWTDPIEVIRNDVWDSYDIYGGNCNNFISQCLNAGGIPMDFVGQAQWKYFDDEVDFSEWPTGRSSSWAGVEEFFEYAENNEGTGLIANTKVNVYEGEPGDVLQYGVSDNWKHSVIVVDIIKDTEGRVVDYLINSNTTDRTNYPTSAYAYTNLRLIKILGYQN